MRLRDSDATRLVGELDETLLQIARTQSVLMTQQRQGWAEFQIAPPP